MRFDYTLMCFSRVVNIIEHMLTWRFFYYTLLLLLLLFLFLLWWWEDDWKIISLWHGLGSMKEVLLIHVTNHKIAYPKYPHFFPAVILFLNSIWQTSFEHYLLHLNRLACQMLRLYFVCFFLLENIFHLENICLFMLRRQIFTLGNWDCKWYFSILKHIIGYVFIFMILCYILYFSKWFVNFKIKDFSFIF